MTGPEGLHIADAIGINLDKAAAIVRCLGGLAEEMADQTADQDAHFLVLAATDLIAEANLGVARLRAMFDATTGPPAGA